MAIVSHDFYAVVGVDTHARTHTFVILDSASGTRTAAETFPTTAGGMDRAVAWINRNTTGRVLAAVEGTGCYGARLAEVLNRADIRVVEMDVPVKRNTKHGKSDPIDAESAARRALALPTEQLATPRQNSGDRSALKVLLSARVAMTKSRTEAINQLTALLRIFDLGVDARRPLTASQIGQVAGWRPRRTDETGTAAARAETVRLAREILRRDSELVANKAGLLQHVSMLDPGLLDQTRVGPVTAAQLLAAYSHKGRIRSEAAFARLAGVAPIPASSGNTIRHRLHRGGDRQLNQALWRIAFLRYFHDPATADYVARKIAEGRTRPEIIRSLKRYIARSLFRHMDSVMP